MKGSSLSAVTTDPAEVTACPTTGDVEPSLCATEPLRLMAVHAHPDDESSKGAATMARYVTHGVDVLVVTLTGGERGACSTSAGPPGDPGRPGHGSGAGDGGGTGRSWASGRRGSGSSIPGSPGDPLPPLPEGCFALQPLETAARPLVRAVRAFRPQVILGYDENGGYPHPDHVKCHKVTIEAFEAAGDPDRYPDCGEPWQPAEALLLRHVPQGPVHGPARGAAAARPGIALRGAPGRVGGQPGPPRARDHHPGACADFFEVRDQALLAHATQIDPDGGWFACPREVQVAAWPTEDFHLARSVVDTEKPEDDLFAGVRDSVRRISGVARDDADGARPAATPGRGRWRSSSSSPWPSCSSSCSAR